MRGLEFRITKANKQRNKKNYKLWHIYLIE